MIYRMRLTEPRLVFLFVLAIVVILPAFAGYTVAAQISAVEQESKYNKFEYGVHTGIFIASNSTAQFYSGMPGNENSAEYIFENEYWYNEIMLSLNAHTSVKIEGYPQKMKYNPTLGFGAGFRYNMSERYSLNIQFYSLKYKVKDFITVEVDPKEYLTERDIRYCPVIGTEERVALDIGLTRTMTDNPVANLIVGAGLSMNSTMVKQSSIFIGNTEYNMIRIYGNRPYVPNSNLPQFEIRQGGVGFGFYGNVSIKLRLSDYVSAEPGIGSSFQQNMIVESAGLKYQLSIYLKLMLSTPGNGE